LVKTDQTVIVCGQLDRRRAETQVILDRIIPLEQARERLTQSIQIQIKTVGLEKDFLDKLKAIMSKHPGMCPVYLHLQTPHAGEVVIAPDSNVRVGATLAFRQEIESLLGKGSIQFKS
jgi:DNA polymerase III alpha subunit